MARASPVQQVLEDIRRTRFTPQTRSERVAHIADSIASVIPYKNTAWVIVDDSGGLLDCITYPHCYPELQKVYASKFHHSTALTGFLPWRLALSWTGVFDLGEVTMGMCYRSEFHRVCMVPVGLHASLCMPLISESGRAYGFLALGRPPGEVFSTEDRRALTELKQEIGRVVASNLLDRPDTPGSVVEDEGLLIVSHEGTLKDCDIPGKRLLWLASHPHLDREQSDGDAENGILQRLADTAREALAKAAPGLAQSPVLRITHDRGQYDFRIHLLGPDPQHFGVVVWRSTSRLARIARRLIGLSAGPRQKDIALLLARGFSYPEIAEELGIAVSSVTTQVRSLFLKFSVNSREELIAELDKGPNATEALEQ